MLSVGSIGFPTGAYVDEAGTDENQRRTVKFTSEPVQPGERTTMRVLRRVCLIAAIVAPGIALTDAAAAPDATVLGTTEAILEHCAKIDPTAAAKYQERVKLLVQGADEQKVAEIRKSDAYRQAYDSTTARVGESDPETARRACAKFLAGQ
jgi:hypothetical protein